MTLLRIILKIVVGWPIVTFIAAIAAILIILMAVLGFVAGFIGYVPAVLWQEYIETK